MNGRSPSPVANWLLECALPQRHRDAVLGDLIEEYALRTHVANRVAVSRWYWGQVCRSIPRMLWTSMRRERWLPTLGAALGAYIAAGIMEFAATKAITRLFTLGSQLYTVVSVVVGLTTMVLGGFLAAWLRPMAAIAFAAIVMIVVAVLMITMSDSQPLWYQLAFLFVGPLAPLVGGAFCVRIGANRRGRPP